MACCSEVPGLEAPPPPTPSHLLALGGGWSHLPGPSLGSGPGDVRPPLFPCPGPKGRGLNRCCQDFAWRLGSFRQKGEPTHSYSILARNTSLMSFGLTRESLVELFLSRALSLSLSLFYHLWKNTHTTYIHRYTYHTHILLKIVLLPK